MRSTGTRFDILTLDYYKSNYKCIYVYVYVRGNLETGITEISKYV